MPKISLPIQVLKGTTSEILARLEALEFIFAWPRSFNTVTANHTLTAAFAIDTYALTIATTGRGSGVVTPAIGTHIYLVGSVVTVTESPALYSSFSRWSGDCSGTGTCVVMMTGDRSVTADFEQYRLYLPLIARND